MSGDDQREPMLFAATTTDDELMAEDRPFDRAQQRRGGWARVEVGRDIYYGYVRAAEVFGVTRCEILIPFADRPGVSSRLSYRGRDIYSIEGVSKSEVLEQLELEDEGAP
jgi:hypothetical protein